MTTPKRKSYCVACGRELEDPVSALIGLGSKCRIKYANNPHIQRKAAAYQARRQPQPIGTAPNG